MTLLHSLHYGLKILKETAVVQTTAKDNAEILAGLRAFLVRHQ